MVWVNKDALKMLTIDSNMHTWAPLPFKTQFNLFNQFNQHSVPSLKKILSALLCVQQTCMTFLECNSKPVEPLHHTALFFVVSNICITLWMVHSRDYPVIFNDIILI